MWRSSALKNHCLKQPASYVRLGPRSVPGRTPSILEQRQPNATSRPSLRTVHWQRARVVHFATHGLLAQETKNIAGAAEEPALLLTPPKQATAEDDGLLTASEIAQLKLDADWVVLSACNTAAGKSALETEPLSGLARAFFYAGTRAILVTHWYVNSQAAVALVTKTFAELETKPQIGRAEALRLSMLALATQPATAHPAIWAPFVLVGEGAR